MISSSDNKSNSINCHLGDGGGGQPNILPQSVLLDKLPLNLISKIEKNIQTFQANFLFYSSFGLSFMKKTVQRIVLCRFYIIGLLNIIF